MCLHTDDKDILDGNPFLGIEAPKILNSPVQLYFLLLRSSSYCKCQEQIVPALLLLDSATQENVKTTFLKSGNGS